MSSLLNDVAERVGDVFSATFKDAGYDPRNAPIYAHELIGMVTFVGQWWTEARKPDVEEVANHLAALGWMGLRHLALGPAPQLRECPHCGSVGMRAATQCGRWRRKLVPPDQDPTGAR